MDNKKEEERRKINRELSIQRSNKILQQKRESGELKSVSFSIDPEAFKAIAKIKKEKGQSYADIFRWYIKENEKEKLKDARKAEIRAQEK